MRDVLFVIGWTLMVAGIGWAIIWWLDRRQRQKNHREMCTSYNPCPECRSRVEEPLSNFDRWDGLR